MSTALEELYQFERELRHSMDQDDWMNIADLDSQCRDLVSRVMDEMSSLHDRDAQKHYNLVLQGLADLYEQLQSRCVAARNSAATNLQKMHRGRQAQRSYQIADA